MILLSLKNRGKPLTGMLLLCALLYGTPATSRQNIKEIPESTSISAMTGDKTLTSTKGQEILVYTFASKEKQPAYRFLIQGGMHGNESQASLLVLWMAKRYARGESLLNKLAEHDVAFDFLPYLNPDGVEEHNRYNARGVNLNRNFDVLWGVSRENPGKSSFSEAETRALKKLFEKQKYAAAVDVHGYINWIVAPSSPEALKELGHEVSKKQATAYRLWEAAVKRQMNVMPGYQFKTAAELGDGGAFEDWAFYKHNTLSYCLEMDSWFRYLPAKKRSFGDLRQPSFGKVDKYVLYETFVFRMFEEAIEIKKALENDTQMASSL